MVAGKINAKVESKYSSNRSIGASRLIKKLAKSKKFQKSKG